MLRPSLRGTSDSQLKLKARLCLSVLRSINHSLSKPNIYSIMIVFNFRSPGFVFASFLVAVTLISPAPARTQVCYGTDGSLDTNGVPCDPSSAVSPCCHIEDYCLTNGFCLNGGADNAISRGTCTDQNWESSACPQYCRTGSLSFLLFASSSAFLVRRA
jgi:hypothetical protein